ncbi:DMT family transporter [Oceanobacter mangrovi]|uniref:DMT family transporter n=1 Tax=Oceanobacter mangrovi TaxID=2862510 RepID=UPI001C8D41CF|nr:DMT family transporter [Oceanobacter mangrovi]
MSRSANTNAVIALVFCAFFWGASFPVGKHALSEMHAVTVVLWRFVIAAVCLLAYARWMNIRMPHLNGRQWWWVIGVSVIGVGGINLGLFTGLEHTAANNGALIMALSPLVTALIGCLAHRQLPSVAQFFSLVVCLAGVLLVLTNGELQRLLGFQFNQGDQMIFGGMLCWSLYTFLTQSISKWMPMIPYTIVGMFAGIAVMLLLAFSDPQIQLLAELHTASAEVLADVLFIGLFGTVGGYLLWISGVKQLGAATASLFFNFVPVFSALTAFLFGQDVTALQLAGMAIVIAGLLLPRLAGYFQNRSALAAAR